MPHQHSNNGKSSGTGSERNERKYTLLFHPEEDRDGWENEVYDKC